MKKIIIKKLKDELVSVPDKIKREFEQVLTSGGLFKIVSKHPNLFGDTHYQILSLKPYEEKDWKIPVDKLINKIKAFEAKYGATSSKHGDIPVTWNFGYQNDKYISAGIDIDKMYVKDSIKDSTNLSALDASYIEEINDRLHWNDADSHDGYLRGNESKRIKEIIKKYNIQENEFKSIAPYIYKAYGYKYLLSLSDSIEDAHEYKSKGNQWLYLFPDEPAMGNYKNECRRFGLEFVGKNRFDGERNLVIRGSKEGLRKYADFLNYDLHPDYLYKEQEFAGDIDDSCKDSEIKDRKSWTEVKENDIITSDRLDKNHKYKVLKIEKEKFSSYPNFITVEDLETHRRHQIRADNGITIVDDSCKDSNPYERAEKGLEKELKDSKISGVDEWVIKEAEDIVKSGFDDIDDLRNKIEDLSEDLTPRNINDIITYLKRNYNLKDSCKDSYEEKVVNGYVIGKFANGGYSVYNNQGHFEEDKNNGYKTEAEAINRAKSLPKGIAIGDSINKHQKLVKMISVIKAFKDAKVKDYDERILNKLKEIAQQGEKLEPVYENLMFNIKKHMGSTYQQIQEFKNEYPQKYNLIKSQEESLNKKVETLSKEWNKYIDLIARGSNRFPRAINSLPTMTEYNQVLGEIQNLQERKGKKPWKDSKVKDNMLYTEKNGMIFIIKDGKVIVKFPDKKSAIDAGYDIDGTIKRK